MRVVTRARSEHAFVLCVSAWGCSDRFSKVTDAGDIVPREHSVTKSYCALSRTQTVVTFDIYKFKSPVTVAAVPRLTTDRGCVLCGTLSSPCGNVGAPAVSRVIEFTLVFGRTQVTAKAKDVSTGTVTNVQIEWKNVQ